MSGWRTFGDAGSPVVYLHGITGLLAEEPLLEALGRDHRVFAPVWPGYGEGSDDEGRLLDMLDFTLHGWDLVDSLGLDEPPALVGHDLGGMIAAEMAAVARHDLSRLVLIAPYGLWDDADPLPDPFAMLPFELAEALFADPAAGEKLLTAGTDFGDNSALTDYLVRRARSMGMAGRVLFPVPCRHVERRLHRVAAPTLVVWGAEDRLVPASHAGRWVELIDDARSSRLDGAGHMVTHERPADVADAVRSFLGPSGG